MGKNRLTFQSFVAQKWLQIKMTRHYLSKLHLLAMGDAEGIAEAVGLKKTAKKGTVEKGVKMVVVKSNADGWLWVYNKPDWGAKYQKVKTGEAFTIDKTLTFNGSKMYKLKSGL
ncbi:hypothetical protein [Bacillus paralicheniformis]|uniref:hypothetical protein n=1 Tax=Bacillus paralicheniformis TaxID=1648923 RepID=UPI0035F5ECAF